MENASAKYHKASRRKFRKIPGIDLYDFTERLHLYKDGVVR